MCVENCVCVCVRDGMCLRTEGIVFVRGREVG